MSDAQHAPEPAPTRPPNDLPEAHDSTTEQIHRSSNFFLSEKIGLPLLTGEPKTATTRTSGAEAEGRLFGSRTGATARSAAPLAGLTSGEHFSAFLSQDWLIVAATAVMILGPLFFGAFR